jgi:hypothetical protein
LFEAFLDYSFASFSGVQTLVHNHEAEGGGDYDEGDQHYGGFQAYYSSFLLQEFLDPA